MPIITKMYGGRSQIASSSFLTCSLDSDTVNLFDIGGMKATEHATRLGPPKSVFEGAERDRKWDCYIPGGSGTGTVVSIEESSDGRKTLKMRGDNGRNQTHTVPSNHHLYVNIGDTFTKGAAILSGIVPHLCNCGCSQEQYDFYADLHSDVNETVYTAVKALGYLPATDHAISELQHIANDSESDGRIRLEAFASLLRLTLPQSWHWFCVSHWIKSLRNCSTFKKNALLLVVLIPLDGNGQKTSAGLAVESRSQKIVSKL